MSQSNVPTLDVESAVRERYSRGAAGPEAELCCPSHRYDSKYLAVIPQEVVERDYGCGDPSHHLRAGETVLDLGAGAGKACFIAAQVVGPAGRVIGIDMNDDMLAVARRNAPKVAQSIGYQNVEFRKGKIQDLRLDLDALANWLRLNPVHDYAGFEELEAQKRSLREQRPLVPDESVDVVISNCVLNLVSPTDKQQLFNEIFRVLRRGGRAVISDITSDEDVPDHLQRNPELWSGCISGALREDRFLQAFEDAGLYGISILSRDTAPWRTVEGIEFRSLTVVAYKGKEGPCWEGKQAVIYRGPFKEVRDDDGHLLRRGMRVAVCEKTFDIYSREPYRDHFEFVQPLTAVPTDQRQPFPCAKGALIRNARETKGADYKITTDPLQCCGENGDCC